MSQQPQPVYDFGPFRFLPDEKLLLRHGQPVSLPPKAIDTLAALLERHGHVVLKDDLMRRVWPDTFVEEGNLTQQISLLRKAFAEAGVESISIETVPRRGYRLMAAVTCASSSDLLVMHERTRAEVVIEETSAGRVTRARSLTWLRATTLLLVAALGGVLATYWFTASRPALPFERRDWILLLDFENTTGDARFDRALAPAFSVGLEQSGYFNVYSKARLGGALKRMGKPTETPLTEEIGTEVARRDGIRALVACSVTRLGNQFVLTARLIDPQRMTAVDGYSASAADEDHLLEALNRLSRSVRHALGESRLAISRASKPLPQVTTSSFAALQAYVEAGRAWNSGRVKDGIAGWERALALDPGFALAHAELGSALSSHVMLDTAKSKHHFETALSLTDRTTDRERRLIEARYVSVQGHWEDVIRIYDTYLMSYPDDSSAHLNRGLALMRIHRYDEAIAGFEDALRINQANAAALINIATCYNTLGRDREAVELYERAFELEPSWLTVANLNHEFGFALVGAGDLAKASKTFRSALQNPETMATAWRSLALLDLYQGRYRDAEAKLRESQLASPGALGALRRARNQLFLAIIREGQGRPANPLQELDRAAAALAELPPNVQFALRTAAAYARAGAVEKAERLVQSVHPHPEEPNAEIASELRRALGEIALARSDYARALEAFRAADLASSSAMTLESLAFAHGMAGNAGEATSAYGKLVASTDWPGWEPQQRWIEAHLRLAELNIARGDISTAVRLLDAFLARWQEADADLPLLAQARRLRLSLRR